MKKNYDVIIIGAGIAGLICGAFLAKKGIKVLICEKNSMPGGCCMSFKRHGAIIDAGAHIIGSCAKQGLFGRILRELDVECEFLRIDPTDRYIFPKEIIEVPRNVNDYKILLQNRFSNEKNGIEHYFDALTKIYKKNGFIMDNSIFNLSAQGYLDSYFENERLKTILLAQCGFLGAEPKRVSAVAFIMMTISYLFEGSFYTSGGIQNLVNALADIYKRYGGILQLNNEVRRIVLKKNNVEGVMLADGTQERSRFVVSCIDAKHTFLRLLGDKAILNNRIKKKLSSFATSISLNILYIIIDSSIGLALRSISGWNFHSCDLNNDFYKNVYISTPTLIDRSLTSDGRHVIIIYQPTKKTPDQIYKKQEAYDKYKKTIESKLIGAITDKIRNFKKYIIYKELSTPHTIHRYTHNSNGSIFGWDMIPGQLYNKGMHNNSSVKGLYLAGHWTNLGGGVVSVALSGKKTANKILKNI